MSRSTKKGPFVDPKLLKKVMNAQNSSGRNDIKTWSRASKIIEEMMSSDYENLLQVFDSNFGSFVILER